MVITPIVIMAVRSAVITSSQLGLLEGVAEPQHPLPGELAGPAGEDEAEVDLRTHGRVVILGIIITLIMITLIYCY